MKDWLNKFLFMYVSIRNPDYRRLITANFIISCTFLALVLFIISNFINQNSELVYNAVLMLSILLLQMLIFQGNKWQLLHSIMVLLGAGYLFLILRNPGLQYIANWALIYSYLLLVIYGVKTGALLALIYFTVSAYIVFSWVGVSLDFSGFLRYVIVGGFILLLAYITELLIERVVNRLASSQSRLKHLTITDDLTNIYNRRHFNSMLAKELVRCKETRKQLAFAMIDIDYFKPFNDFYGHQEGDIALIKVAKLLRFKLKQLGYHAFRIGGEEFALLFYVKDQSEALHFLQELREDVAKLKILHIQSPISEHLTLSIGLKMINYDHQYDDEEVYKACDDLLYQAKERGRNQIVCEE